MEIYFVRHTKPSVAEGLCYGQTDLDVAESFKEEAEQVIQALPTSFDRIYSSPLKRCLRLAQELSSDIIIDDRLLELNFGDWEMKRWDEIPQEELNPWMKDYLNKAPPNGETANQLIRRVATFYDDLKTNAPGKNILIVGHLGPIRCFYALLNNTSLEESFMNFKLSYGESYQTLVSSQTKTSG